MKKYVLIISILLSACGKSEVNSVKNDYVDMANTTTTSQLLDNRKLCEKIKWESFEDEKSRRVVEYKCILKDSSDYLSEEREKFVRQTVDYNSSNRSAMESEIESRNAELESDYPEISGEISRLQAKLNELISAAPSSTERLVRLEGLAVMVSDLNKNYDDRRLIEMLFSRSFADLDLRDLRAGRGQGDLGTLRIQLGYLSGQRSDRYDDYKRTNIDPYLNFYKSRLNEIFLINQNAIEAEKQSIHRKNQDNIDRLQGDIASEEKRKVDNSNSSKKRIEILKNEINALNEQFDVSLVESQALKKYPKYEYVAEKFQWIVNKDGKPSLVYGEVSAYVKDNHKSIAKYNRPNQIFEMISKSDTDDYRVYLKQLGAFSFFKALGY